MDGTVHGDEDDLNKHADSHRTKADHEWTDNHENSTKEHPSYKDRILGDMSVNSYDQSHEPHRSTEERAVQPVRDTTSTHVTSGQGSITTLPKEDCDKTLSRGAVDVGQYSEQSSTGIHSDHHGRLNSDGNDAIAVESKDTFEAPETAMDMSLSYHKNEKTLRKGTGGDNYHPSLPSSCTKFPRNAPGYQGAVEGEPAAAGSVVTGETEEIATDTSHLDDKETTNSFKHDNDDTLSRGAKGSSQHSGPPSQTKVLGDRLDNRIFDGNEATAEEREITAERPETAMDMSHLDENESNHSPAHEYDEQSKGTENSCQNQDESSFTILRDSEQSRENIDEREKIHEALRLTSVKPEAPRGMSRAEVIAGDGSSSSSAAIHDDRPSHQHLDENEAAKDKSSISRAGQSSYTMMRINALNHAHFDEGEVNNETSVVDLFMARYTKAHLGPSASKVSEPTTHKCHLCLKSFAKKKHLKKHKLEHAGDGKDSLCAVTSFKCDICALQFAKKKHLKKHISEHKCADVSKPFICDICPLRFTKKKHLKRHVLKHNYVDASYENKEHNQVDAPHYNKEQNSADAPYEDKTFMCDVCAERFSDQSDLQKHIVGHITDMMPLKCDVCREAFANLELLKEHVTVHRDSGHHVTEKPYACSVCTKSFDKTYKLHNHMIAVHSGIKPFQCDFCSKSFAEPIYLRKHLKRHAEEKPFICEVCSKTFAVNQDLRSHMKSHVRTDLFQCEECESTFVTQAGLKKHMNIHSGAKPYVCDVCLKCFADPNYLQRHMKRHNRSRFYICSVCNKGFTRQDDGALDLSVRFGEKTTRNDVCSECLVSEKSCSNISVPIKEEPPIRCDVCAMGFGSMVDLDQHMKTHSEEGPSRRKGRDCPECGKSFSRGFSLRRHMKLHSEGDSPISEIFCPECGKNFSNHILLSEHRKTHVSADDSGLEHKCYECGKSFANKFTLSRHTKLHTGSKPFKCHMCHKRFADSNYLHKHLKSHSAETREQFKCELCEKTFGRRYLLTRHMSEHSGVKPYRCSICGKAFSDPSYFQEHMARHIGEKSFICSICSRGFAIKGDLRKHMATHI